MFELENVSKRYGDVVALHTTSLKLCESKVHVLLGTSGCGKSTLLKLMMGLVPPDTGKVSLAGTTLNDQNVESLRLRVGYVIQRGGLFPHLSVTDNVSLIARYLGWETNRINVRIAELLDLVRLPTDVLKRFPRQISGGQQQRVALMRALMLNPDVLLMDEPLGALDPIIRSELQRELRSIFRDLNQTVVLVTHDLNEAAFFADEVILMNSGKILQRGTIHDLIDRPVDRFVSQFVSAQQSHLPISTR